MKTVADEFRELRSLRDPWDIIFRDRERFSVRAVAVFRANCGIAGDFKHDLEGVDDQDLDLLATLDVAKSAVKTKLLTARIRRRNKDLKRSILFASPHSGLFASAVEKCPTELLLELRSHESVMPLRRTAIDKELHIRKAL